MQRTYSNVLLTIAVPNYNGGAHVQRALMSCLHVDLPSEHFEVLFLDNASTDDSVAYACEIQHILPNLRIEISSENLGRVENWNRALDLARGRYLVYLFASDELTHAPSFTEKIERMCETRAGLMVCDYLRIESGQPYVVGKESRAAFERNDGIEVLDDLLSRAHLPFAPIQKNVYDLAVVRSRHLRFDPNLPVATDQVFSFLVALYSSTVISSTLPHFIWHATEHRFHASISVAQMIQADATVIDLLADYLPRQPNWARAHAHLLLRILQNRTVVRQPFTFEGELDAARFVVRRSRSALPLVIGWLLVDVFRAFYRRALRHLFR